MYDKIVLFEDTQDKALDLLVEAFIEKDGGVKNE